MRHANEVAHFLLNDTQSQGLCENAPQVVMMRGWMNRSCVAENATHTHEHTKLLTIKYTVCCLYHVYRIMANDVFVLLLL